ncbi:MAG: sigma-70 family RNA polymerase sigma factor [Bacteroidetes bacterium]|nr:sigma-70 family RNA polymerase sigma factor [Bacteroidota bacterium]
MKVVRKYDDVELIAAINDKKNLDDAILYIYQNYSETVSSFITNNGGSQQDADDIFQETVVAFIDIVKKGKYRMEASIKTFLVSVARNIWFNQIKKKERSGRREKLYEDSRGTDEMDVSHYISDREVKQEFRELLIKLGEPCRKILTLFYYENLSMKEMVDQLPYENEQVVRNKKYKCLLQLTEMIKANPLIASQINEIIK